MAEKPAPKQRTLYFTGEARTTSDNAITRIYGTFYLAFEVAAGTGEILDVDCNATLELTRKFVKTIFMHHFLEKDAAFLEAEIQDRYYGSSSRAILAAYRDALAHYRQAQGK